MDTLINCYKCPCRQRQSKLVNLETERDGKPAIKWWTPVVQVWRQCFLYISIFIAVHSRSFHAQSNIKTKLICWQLFRILNISISSQTHPHNKILFKGKIDFNFTTSDSEFCCCVGFWTGKAETADVSCARWEGCSLSLLDRTYLLLFLFIHSNFVSRFSHYTRRGVHTKNCCN